MKGTHTHPNLRTQLLTLAALAATLWSLTGCIIITDGQPAPNDPPYVSDTYVDCFWDSYYNDYGWDFMAYVDDADGYRDVSDVYVEVFDSSGYLESWDLVYDGNGQWSNTVYETYSTYLNCDYLYYYEFDFYAYDYYGDSDSVTYLP